MQSLNKHTIVETENTTAPFDAAEFKAFLKFEGSGDDTLVDDLIQSARLQIEQIINKPLLNTTYKQFQDNFEISNLTNYSIRDQLAFKADINTFRTKNAFIRLMKKPVVSISSVTLYDSANNTSTYSSDNYFLDTAGAKLIINDEAALPTDIRNRAGIEVEYVAGFGASASDIPEDIKTAAKMYVQSMYDFNRGAETLIATAYEMPTAAMNILKKYQDYRLNG